MDISIEIIISTIAAILTTSAFLPQAVKVVTHRETKALSFWMYLLFTIGVSFWLIYGLMIKSYPLIIANLITFVLSLVILIIKIINTYKNK
ncbi:MAG: MtN3 and saliva related transmembrane protein [Rickettsiales bacterium]|jgi:MtN3 and saliva related transmembrane protein